MCGICGIAIPDHSSRRLDPVALRRMRDSLAHRGPDDAGLLLDSHIALAHRRLAIVDLSPSGHQPMFNEDRSFAIVFNGEIYNHLDFRSDLLAHGHRYRSASDTETILHLFEQHQDRAVEHLRGMFAFAISDRRHRLWLARDRLGIKPLYYTLADDGTLHFASEIKALLAAAALKPELNFAALADFAANRSTSGEATLFRGVKRLLPGHTLLWDNGRVAVRRFWDVSFKKSPDRLRPAEAVARFAELFEEAVRLRLMSDVPLGMFLSGGLDSSAIAAVMSRLVKAPIKTFSVAFAEREANELEYARQVAAAFKTEHHEVVVSPGEFFAALPRLVYQEDEPLAHPSSVPLYFVSRLARQHVKVVLTGEGADELLAGYDKYRKTVYNLALGRRYHEWMPESIKRGVASLIGGRRGSSRWRQKLQRTFLCLAPELQTIYFDNFAVFGRGRQAELFTEEARERMGEGEPYEGMLEPLRRTDAEGLLDQLLAVDLKTYLQELLMKQDQMSMAASIESRVPFLDHRLVEWVCGLPEGMKLRGLETKHILRQAMKGVLPGAILRRRKMGFPVPVGAWLRGGYRHMVEEYVLSERAQRRGIFEASYVKELVRRHDGGENQAERLWMLVNFEMWQRQFFDGEVIDCHTDSCSVNAHSSAPLLSGQQVTAGQIFQRSV
jgi:asparagine synthase (glutamine-hydrolysing)